MVFTRRLLRGRRLVANRSAASSALLIARRGAGVLHIPHGSQPNRKASAHSFSTNTSGSNYSPCNRDVNLNASRIIGTTTTTNISACNTNTNTFTTSIIRRGFYIPSAASVRMTSQLASRSRIVVPSVSKRAYSTKKNATGHPVPASDEKDKAGNNSTTTKATTATGAGAAAAEAATSGLSAIASTTAECNKLLLNTDSHEKAIQILSEMHERNLPRNSMTYITVIDICAKNREFEAMRDAFHKSLQDKMPLDLATYAVMVSLTLEKYADYQQRKIYESFTGPLFLHMDKLEHAPASQAWLYQESINSTGASRVRSRAEVIEDPNNEYIVLVNQIAKSAIANLPGPKTVKVLYGLALDTFLANDAYVGMLQLFRTLKSAYTQNRGILDEEGLNYILSLCLDRIQEHVDVAQGIETAIQYYEALREKQQKKLQQQQKQHGSKKPGKKSLGFAAAAAARKKANKDENLDAEHQAIVNATPSAMAAFEAEYPEATGSEELQPPPTPDQFKTQAAQLLDNFIHANDDDDEDLIDPDYELKIVEAKIKVLLATVFEYVIPVMREQNFNINLASAASVLLDFITRSGLREKLSKRDIHYLRVQREKDEKRQEEEDAAEEEEEEEEEEEDIEEQHAGQEYDEDLDGDDENAARLQMIRRMRQRQNEIPDIKLIRLVPEHEESDEVVDGEKQKKKSTESSSATKTTTTQGTGAKNEKKPKTPETTTTTTTATAAAAAAATTTAIEAAAGNTTPTEAAATTTTTTTPSPNVELEAEAEAASEKTTTPTTDPTRSTHEPPKTTNNDTTPPSDNDTVNNSNSASEKETNKGEDDTATTTSSKKNDQ